MIKKILFFGVMACWAMTGFGQTWQIGSPNAADVTATLSNGKLTISGAGAMQDFEYYYSTPWFWNCDSINSLVMEQGVTTIGNNAFQLCEYLSSVTIPNSVTSIGDYAFAYCYRLSSVTIPNSVTSIGDYAFSGCNSLSSVTIPNAVTSIGNSVFSGCSLSSVTIPNSVTFIGDYAFANCSGLSSVTIPNSVTSIGDYAFAYCYKLSYIKLPKSLTHLGAHLFSFIFSYQTIEVEWDIPLAITSNIFSDMIDYCVLIVPKGTTALYKAANVWKYFQTIKEINVHVAGISLSQTSATFTGNERSLQLTATVAPANASLSDVIWTSSNTNVATVSTTGLVYVYYGGTAVITATTADGGYSASCTVTVQYGDGTFIGIAGRLDYNFSHKAVSGFTDSIAYLDFSKKAPFNISVQLSANSPTVHPVKVSLYVPKKEFADAFPLTCAYTFADQTYVTSVNQNGTGNYHYPTLDDLVKVKEFAIDTSLVWSWNSGTPDIQCYNISLNIPWDDMTDPAFTDGIRYPVHDNVWVVVTDAQTGDVLLFDSQNWLHPSRLSGSYLSKFTSKENSVLCDVYFTSQIPVKKAVSFFGDECSLWNADRSELYKGDIGSMVLSLARMNDPTRWGDINYKAQEYIIAYLKFDNLSPDENGIYHISWEVKDLQGNFLDIGKLQSSDNGVFLNIGLYVEGDGQQTYNLGIPEYGGQYHSGGEYWPIYPIEANSLRVPSPLNPTEIVNYSEFEIDNGRLMYYHGVGGNIAVPNTVNSIGEVAFYGNTNIQSVTMPSTVTKIGDYTFSDCSGLKSVTIPSSVTSIGERAFYRCSSLKSITCLNPDPNNIMMGGDYVFDEVNKFACVLNVPSGSASLYRNADQWKDFAHINETTTGIASPKIQILTLSPNPVKDELFIKSGLPIKTVEIYSSTGALLLSDKNFKGKISMLSLPKGIYLVKVYADKGITVSKIVKE